jgi:hypothetical protein
MIVLGLVIAVLIIFTVGLFSFEVNRLEVARQQLRSACEAAALAAAATLASQDSMDSTAAHTDSINTALTSFHSNSVAGYTLAPAILVSTNNDNPSADMSSLYIEFLDPHNNNQPVNLGDPAGKIVRITAAFGLRPAFGQYLGLPNVVLRATASGGVPDLDVILCFDISGSIDDQTPVTFVKRRWNTTTNKIQYQVTSGVSGAPAGSLAQGKIFDILGPVPTGTRVNAIPPQYLTNSNTSDIDYKLHFSEKTGSSGSAKGLRGSSNAGSPPGNRPPGTAGVGNNQTYTDLVVNIDGKNVFAGITSGAYNFPDIGTVVEAARGNLDSSTLFTNSKANVSLPSNVQPLAGYQAKYYELAAKNIHPLYDAQQAAIEFFTIMNTNTDGHFGFITFDDNAGTSANDSYNDYKVDSTYNAGGSANFPEPNISLNNATGVTNFTTICSAIPTTVATRGTNIGEAVYFAVQQLNTKNRPGSKKAIVLFTDGQPTAGGPLNSDPWTNARKAAQEAKKYGVPIYTIGLAQNPEIIPGEVEILNDTNSNPNTGGMAAIAGNGGKFFLVTNQSDLRKTFENIARHLVQLVR